MGQKMANGARRCLLTRSPPAEAEPTTGTEPQECGERRAEQIDCQKGRERCDESGKLHHR
jgi:hypothetical protein